MTASEFAFLALGLILGVASGAALIEVLRARPPVSREVRLTVAPNAIHARMAATLADPHGTADPAAPARGGPGDRRWRDEVVATGEPAATGRRGAGRRGVGPMVGTDPDSGTPVRIGMSPVEPDPSTEPAAWPPSAWLARPVADPDPPASATERPASSPRAPAANPRPAPLWLSPAGSHAGLVAVPMSMEPDPVTAALRATAAASAVAAMSAAVRARVDAAGPDASAGPATRPARRSAAVAARARAGAVGAAASADEAPSASAGAAAGGGVEVASAPAADGPCAEERRIADERCAVATRAREGAVAAADSLHQAQRTYDELTTRAEAAAAAADPRAVRVAKEQAQQRFREARSGARTRDDVEAGAREWLAEINRINHDTREAVLATERDRAAAAALAVTLERLAVEADAARISAERAEEACIAAREDVAACDEARTVAEAVAARARERATDAVVAAAADAAEAQPAGRRADRIAAAAARPADELGAFMPMHSQADQDALILRILRGDREAMQRAVARLAGDDDEARRRWQTLLGALAEALIARSIEATTLEFPDDHPFWGAFTQSQSRDIAGALSSLGFRFDGFGDWVDERWPSQRDLSLAVGYAGLDPMRIRRWPNEAETRDLLRDVRVAADEYVAGAAGGLTLGELVTTLGRRADGLTELWNEWGSVRPILLEAG